MSGKKNRIKIVCWRTEECEFLRNLKLCEILMSKSDGKSFFATPTEKN